MVEVVDTSLTAAASSCMIRLHALPNKPSKLLLLLLLHRIAAHGRLAAGWRQPAAACGAAAYDGANGAIAWGGHEGDERHQRCPNTPGRLPVLRVVG